MGLVTSHLPSPDRARIDARYPRKRLGDYAAGGLMLVTLVVIVVIVAIAGVIKSNPPVVAMVRAFETQVDKTTAELVVQRRDPAQPATCFVYVQAENYERVGEVDLEVPAGTEKLTVVEVEVRTVREGTAVSVENCRNLE